MHESDRNRHIGAPVTTTNPPSPLSSILLPGLREQQNPPLPRLPPQRKCDKTFLPLLPYLVLLSSLFSSLPFSSFALTFHSNKDTAIIRQSYVPLYHLIPSTVLLRSLPFAFNFCASGIRRARAPSQAQARSTTVVPSDFVVTTHFLFSVHYSIFTDSDHPSVCTTHVCIPVLQLVMESICFENSNTLSQPPL